MYKFIYEVINFFMPRGNIVNNKAEELFNAIIPVYTDPLDLSNWMVTQVGNWGSARPDNISVEDASMVYLENGNMVVATKTHPEGITGKGWSGETSEVRYYMAGTATSNYKVKIGQSLSVLCTINPVVGCCPAIWQFPSVRDEEEMAFYNKYYREIDLLESYPNDITEIDHILQTFHSGGKEPIDRRMFNKNFYKQGSYNQKLLFTLDLYEKKFILKINGVKTGIYYPRNGEWNSKGMNVIISAAVTKERTPFYYTDIRVRIPLGKVTVHGIKIKNL